MTTYSLREGTLSFDEESLVFSHKEVGSHSIPSGFSIELYMAKVYPETIMIMRRWASSAFLRHILIQVSDLSKGISTLMKNNHAFYTIPEIEVVYHTPGQINTDPQKMSLNKEDETTQLPPSHYRAKIVSKEVNTTPLIIYSEYQHGNMVSLLLPKESIYQNPRLPGRTGKILFFELQV